jgi:hypothetical protein
MPDITREQLEAEAVSLEAAKDQAMANLNAIIGALNLCRKLLAGMEAPKTPKAKS